MTYKEQASQWHLALPSTVERTEPILPVVVNNITFGIPLEQVQYVDHASTLTALPLTSPPIEGLIQFNHLPLIQFNLAQVLGFEGKNEGKVVIVKLTSGYLALRVDEVLGFIHFQDGDNKVDADSQIPLLKFDEIFPWIKSYDTAYIPPQKEDIATLSQLQSNLNLNNYILLVSSNHHTIGLLADSVDRIEGIDELFAVRKFDTDADWAVRIEDVLLPARSLATLLGIKTDHQEGQAILIRGLDEPSVLAVEHVSRLEKVNQFHLTTSPTGQKSLWHLTENGEIIEVVNAREFFAKPETYSTLSLVNPQSRWDNLPQLATKLSSEGVRIQCGDVICVLPLVMVDRILSSAEKEELILTDVEKAELDDHTLTKKNIKNKIPVIDCTIFFEQQDHTKTADSYFTKKIGFVESLFCQNQNLQTQEFSKFILANRLF
ncbi:chemotaxis protein CheW [Thioflexithrix psekupsensis]|uniref:CheW-like domain-containing protein n=1 Tax=Thioflexithrix psekupsensis TaxID=1570016 RepID=A0A251X786_9GAMM|nr:chemotaxis protein CheW [Thioflexithrix psekupsensis]OUD13928.1 hypothetical protein TPSD3_06175 [Thioflexithrix psekupsensis]